MLTPDSVHFSSKTDMWSTPQDLFDRLNRTFNFTLDVCATPENAKCDWFFTPEIDGLKQRWHGRVWCNPPYGRQIGKWVEKALTCASDGNFTVMLLPARTDTRWWHDFVIPYANEIEFIKGRLKFGDTKNAMHAIRLAEMITAIASGQKFADIVVCNTDQKNKLLAIKNGAIDKDKMIETLQLLDFNIHNNISHRFDSYSMNADLLAQLQNMIYQLVKSFIIQ